MLGTLKLFLALMAVAGAPFCAVAQSCGSALRGAQTLESAHYVVAYRTQPAKITVGKHFSIDIATCARGNAGPPRGMAVDAYMPEHGHGMNYHATVKSQGGAKPAGDDKSALQPARNNKSALKPAVESSARYRADGLMFHMPGRWDLTFDVQGAGGTERLTRSIVLE